MLTTGAQYVCPCVAFMLANARASRPIWLPVAFHSVRLNAQDVVIGRAVFDWVFTEGLPVMPVMPCVASDHQL